MSSPTQIQGAATLVSKMRGRSYADTAIYGKLPTTEVADAALTNDVRSTRLH